MQPITEAKYFLPSPTVLQPSLQSEAEPMDASSMPSLLNTTPTKLNSARRDTRLPKIGDFGDFQLTFMNRTSLTAGPSRQGGTALPGSASPGPPHGAGRAAPRARRRLRLNRCGRARPAPRPQGPAPSRLRPHRPRRCPARALPAAAALRTGGCPAALRAVLGPAAGGAEQSRSRRREETALPPRLRPRGAAGSPSPAARRGSGAG